MAIATVNVIVIMAIDAMLVTRVELLFGVEDPARPILVMAIIAKDEDKFVQEFGMLEGGKRMLMLIILF